MGRLISLSFEILRRRPPRAAGAAFRVLILAVLLISSPAFAIDTDIKPPAELDYNSLVRSYKHTYGPQSGQSIVLSKEAPAESVAAALGVDMSKAKEIVLVTANPNIGDNLINWFGYLQYLHEQNPKAIIKVISPTSRIFRESDWLKPIQMDAALPLNIVRKNENLKPGSYFSTDDFQKQIDADPEYLSRRIKKAVEPHLSPDAFYLFDDGSIEYWQYLAKKSLPYEGPHVAQLKKDGTNASGWLYRKFNESEHGALAFDDMKIKFLGPKGTNAKIVEIGPLALAQKVPPQYFTNYDTRSIMGRLLFGRDFKLSWPTEHYSDLPSFRPKLDNLLQRSFKKPGAPYIVLNMNTKADMKVIESAPNYLRVYEQVLDHMKKYHPDVNVFIAPVEAPFGSQITRDVEKLVKRNKGKIAFLPNEDKALWNSIVSEAKAIISQDSGFVHLGTVFNKDVLSLTLSKHIPGERWVRPDQSMIRLNYDYEGDNPKIATEEERRIFEWIDKRIPVQTKSSQSCLAAQLRSLLARLKIR